jgi:predicted permease
MLILRVALRNLLKTPVVTLVAIVSLALGIGANAAIFSLFDQLILRPLPVAQADRLVNLGAPGPKPGMRNCGLAGDCDAVFSYQMFRDLEHSQTEFTAMAAHVPFSANLAARGQTLSGDGLLVSGGYFPVLGIPPILGRLLGPNDDTAIGEAHVAVISDAYWETRFGRDPDVLSQPLIVNGETMTIVGVAPRGFEGTTLGRKPVVFVPITMRGFMEPGFNAFDNRRNYWAYAFARLKPGMSLDQAELGLNALYHSIIDDVEAPLQNGMSEQTMRQFKAKRVTLESGARGQSTISGNVRAPLTLLIGVSAFVLLIACANIANLLLARSTVRAGEMAIRLSIGASRWQLVAQLLSESCLLAVFGGAAGLFVARWTLDMIVSLLPTEAAQTVSLTIDPSVILFAAALTVTTGLLFGLFPALHSTRPDLVSSLKGEAGQPSGARSATRFRTWLATAQIAMSMALLVAAGLFTRSLLNVSLVKLGMTVDHVVTFGVAPILNGYKPDRTLQLFKRLEDELAAVPGVDGVTDSVVGLLAGSNLSNDVSVQGYDAGPDADMTSRVNEIGPGYFRTLGIPVIAGREFSESDGASARKVVIVNEAFAKKFNLGRDAIGQLIGSRNSVGNRDTVPPDSEIIGLVENAKYSDLKREIPPQFFRPYRQDETLGYIHFYVRTSLDPESLLPTIPKLVARLDPNLPVEGLRTMPQQVRENVYLDRFIGVLSVAFASVATLLAAVGLYGVLAYTVSQRTREIGLRMALGAPPARVRGMVLRQVGKTTAVGGLIGLAAAVALGRLAQSLLFELKGWDPLVLSGAAVALAIVAFAAGFIPAHRASRVEPILALRHK